MNDDIHESRSEIANSDLAPEPESVNKERTEKKSQDTDSSDIEQSAKTDKTNTPNKNTVVQNSSEDAVASAPDEEDTKINKDVKEEERTALEQAPVDDEAIVVEQIDDESSTEQYNIAPDIDLKEVAQPLGANQTTTDEESANSTENNDAQETPANEETPEALAMMPLDLLDNKILPGTSTRLAWNPEISFNGLSLSTPVLVLHGQQPGPVLCLTAAVHGDELNGIEVIRTVMYDVEPDKLSGSIIGVPIVNLQGFQRNTRFMSDRRDLNRFFPGTENGSLASRVAHSLFSKVITKCDLLVDIHTGSFKRTNLAQVRADMSDPEVVEFTEGFDEMVVVHSKGREGMLRFEAKRIGIKSVTFELGESSRLQKEQVDSGVNGIYGLLKKQKMYSKAFYWGSPSPVYFHSKWLRVSSAGILLSKVELGDDVRKGELLGTVTDPITNESVDISSTIDGKIIGMATDQVVMPGFAAYHIGIKASDIELMEKADIPLSKDDPRPESE
ncbi:MAG: succinylglutamate desuccinylase/aspartoacylase family protein [Pseudomonadota bacterium]